MELRRSLGLFIWGVLKRGYLWLPPIFLDPFDVNKKVVQPMMPETWKFELPWSPEWAPLVLIGLLVWAAVLTFHEHRSRESIKKPDWREEDVVQYILANSKLMRWERAGDRLVENIEIALRDAARCGSIQAWGRPENKNNEQTRPTERSIPQDYWDNGRFNIFRGTSSGKNKKTVYTINLYGTGDYRDVRFNKREILKEWPSANIVRRLLDIKRPARIRLTKGTEVKNVTG